MNIIILTVKYINFDTFSINLVRFKILSVLDLELHFLDYKVMK